MTATRKRQTARRAAQPTLRIRLALMLLGVLPRPAAAPHSYKTPAPAVEQQNPTGYFDGLKAERLRRRLAILNFLHSKAAPVSRAEVQRAVGLPEKITSNYLTALRDEGKVKVSRVSQTWMYEVSR